MKKFFQKIIFFSLISFYFLQIEKVQSIVPYYYFPTIKNLQKQSLYIGKNAYQLLYIVQNKEADMHFYQYINFAFVNFLLLGNNNKELLLELFQFEKSKY